jgi:TonB family protein
MRLNFVTSVILHLILFAGIFVQKPFARKFEGYPVIIPVELVKVEPVKFEAPEVKKMQPVKQEIKKPEPKELEGVTIEKPRKVEPEPEPEPEPPVVEEVEEGKSAEENEDLKLDVEDFPFSYYLAIIKSRIESYWEPPVNTRSVLTLKAIAQFRIQRNGQITEIDIAEGSGDFLYDRSALRALTLASPLPPLPPDYPKSSLGVQFAFKQGF